MTGSAIFVRSLAFELQEPGRQQLKRPKRMRFETNNEVRCAPPCIEYKYRKGFSRYALILLHVLFKSVAET
ncbi:unnamed protein product [Brugia pahangi]|uniref:Uncharacterized protein n=1 Tax=Brugia pahangi TaxID=6280 RepID=A0A0N4T3I4_BRUPA|nr:unnamed protein product [Brugia pahangi]